MEIPSNSIISQPIVDTVVSNPHTREVEPTSASVKADVDEFNGLSQEEAKLKLEDITEKLNFQMQQLDTNIRFSFNMSDKVMVVQVREANTGDIIRELPTKEALRISKYFKESIGMLFDKES
ncbi:MULTISPECIES: flagellar protein FlaG [unclassified Campylobacter]|uniref:flagellar protein FlaG n=1 Tax=unclassified Campylobacter TaxID=2593542 RepID=UPI003D333023